MTNGQDVHDKVENDKMEQEPSVEIMEEKVAGEVVDTNGESEEAPMETNDTESNGEKMNVDNVSNVEKMNVEPNTVTVAAES